ncbi:hypothetical protein BDR22DRAFT_977687 [Usnea florida]
MVSASFSTNRLSVAGSSNYEPSHRSTSTRSTNYPPTIDSRTTKSSTVRSSTVTSATSMSKFMRSASISRENPPPSVSSTLRPPSYASGTSEARKVRASTATSGTSMSKFMRSASTSRDNASFASTTSTLRPPSSASRSSRASTLRASTHTAATSTSKLVRSASTASTVIPQTSTAANSTTSLVSSKSKRNPSFLSAAASRLLWGRPPPGHHTLQPSQIASLTHTLSLPTDTPIYSSLVGALGLPLSRSQFSPVPSCFCDAHFWFERKYIDELTQVIAHELGPQLDKLRHAPTHLLSKRTTHLLTTLQPYQDLFPPSNLCPSSDTTSILSATTTLPPNPRTCPACTLHHLFHSPPALTALTLAAKSRKHHARPWPTSIAWLDPCPGKGIDWDAKWRAESKFLTRDRIRVQRWRRANPALVADGVPPAARPASQQIGGHGPGEGCDFCDGLRLEREDEEELDAVIAEEEEEDEKDEREEKSETPHPTDTDDALSTTPTLRALKEESIIKSYLSSPSSSSPTYHPCAYAHHDTSYPVPYPNDKRASEWARSYQRLVPSPYIPDRDGDADRSNRGTRSGGRNERGEVEGFGAVRGVGVGGGEGGGWF